MPKQFTLFVLLIVSPFCFAQEGSWIPAGAETAYPRTMLKPSEIEEVRRSLSEAHVQQLFTGVANSAFGNYPPNNTSSGDRRARAGIAKNAGFVFLLDRKIANNNVEDLLPQEREALQSKVIAILEQINTDVETIVSFSEWQWRSKELIDYAIAYDMLKGAGVEDDLLINSRSKLQEFAGNLYNEATKSFLGYSLFKSIKNNHALMTAAALGTAAVVLNDAASDNENQQPQNWIDAAMWNIDNILWRDNKRQSEPGQIAGFAEGPYYFKYAFINCLPFIRAMGNFLGDQSLAYTYSNSTRSIRNPYFDPDYENLYDWMRIIRMPDGRMPALDDSFIDMAMPELALTGKTKYNWPLNFQNLHPSQRNTLEKQLNVVVDLRANYIAAHIPQSVHSDTTFYALPVSGNVVFRSSWQEDAIYMHLQAESGRALAETDGHNQADETSFIIHAHGQLFALDPGYLSYGRRHELGNAQNHNMILVNRSGPKIGEPGSTNGSEVTILDAFNHGSLASSEISTTYAGATVNRRVMFIRDKYFIMMDFPSSSSNADFTWQLHGYGLEGGDQATGIYTENVAEQKGLYQKNGVSLLAQVAVENGISSIDKRTDQHEFDYNTTEDHTTMLINKNGVQKTSFLSLLVPFIDQNLSTELLSDTKAAAIKMQDEEHNDFAFSRTDDNSISFTTTETGLEMPIETDAASMFFSQNKEGEIVQYFFTKGKSLQYGNKELVTSSEKADVFYQTKGENTALIHINNTTTLRLAVEHYVISVTGEHVKEWNYDPENKMLNINFTQEGMALVTSDPDYNPDVLTVIASERKTKPFRMYPNPASNSITVAFDDDNIKNGDFVLMNANGKILRQVKFNSPILQIEMGNFPPGVYFGKIIHEKVPPVTEKLIIRGDR